MAMLEEQLIVLKKTFDKYAGKDGDKGSLSKAELADLFHEEIPEMAGDKKQLDQFFASLDGDKDGTVSFPEFVQFAATLMLLYNAF
ncbi:hypothetical protein CgunFtcFv8_019538 [Champsocephalus gunnari]|uniref:EF-hand domain-containing protein n=1 Tax=Champsocephalus gunnari TaxID=52237 RepID=A0AAN8DHI1_CHAGU|nr:hypothetical protein CgunFtcFv8_019538 [Champsocephalus gunnari]